MSYVAAQRAALRLGAVGLVFVVYLAWPRPTIGVVVSLLVLGAVLAAVVELIGRAGAVTTRGPGPTSERK